MLVILYVRFKFNIIALSRECNISAVQKNISLIFVYVLLGKLNNFGLTISVPVFFSLSSVRNLVVSDFYSEIKGSRFESGCQLCAKVSSLQ